MALLYSFDAAVWTEGVVKFRAVVTYGLVSGGGSEAVTGRWPWAVVFDVPSGSFEAMSGTALGVGGMAWILCSIGAEVVADSTIMGKFAWVFRVVVTGSTDVAAEGDSAEVVTVPVCEVSIWLSLSLAR